MFYGYEPVLLETFVQRDRSRGTCYQAANWLYVGQSAGRGKRDRFHRGGLPRKDVRLYPLKFQLAQCEFISARISQPASQFEKIIFVRYCTSFGYASECASGTAIAYGHLQMPAMDLKNTTTQSTPSFG